MIEVSLLQDAEEAAWERFVATHPRATFFHRAGWRRVIGRTYRHDTPFLLARAGGEIRGVLPLIHLRSRLFGDALISTGFCVQGGILAADAAAEIALAEAATALGTERRVAYVELRGDEVGELPGWNAKGGVYAGFRASCRWTKART